VPNPSSVISKLAKKFRKAIRRPAKRGDGYHIRVRTVQIAPLATG
jgi:hypothetical protein